MTKPPQTFRVFIASPSDLVVERAAFKDVIDELNTGFGDGDHRLSGRDWPIEDSGWLGL